MPQMDRRRKLWVPIEYNAVERLEGLPMEGRISLALITDGKCNVVLNKEPLTLCAPCALCLSESDHLTVLDNSLLFAQSFSMAPPFLKSRMSFRQIKGKNGNASLSDDEQDPLMLFRIRNGRFRGILPLPYEAYVQAFEWLSIIGSESAAQSDGRWTCRIRRYFLQIL
ncbi:MAG TPA: AraC family transcriptional regulator, partial [Clostridia bacterium]|nr:AraC family transcriptional regulator [Clostridia bacterium]